MNTAANDIATAALDLDPEHRARLAVQLIESLDKDVSLTEEEIERLWMEEAHERLRQLEHGEVQAIPADQVFAEARNRLK